MSVQVTATYACLGLDKRGSKCKTISLVRLRDSITPCFPAYARDFQLQARGIAEFRPVARTVEVLFDLESLPRYDQKDLYELLNVDGTWLLDAHVLEGVFDGVRLTLILCSSLVEA